MQANGYHYLLFTLRFVSRAIAIAIVTEKLVLLVYGTVSTEAKAIAKSLKWVQRPFLSDIATVIALWKRGIKLLQTSKETIGPLKHTF